MVHHFLQGHIHAAEPEDGNRKALRAEGAGLHDDAPADVNWGMLVQFGRFCGLYLKHPFLELAHHRRVGVADDLAFAHIQRGDLRLVVIV